MKKVLSAVVLSAAVVATAGQAFAYNDFNVLNNERGTMVGVIYTNQTEIILNLGDFLTANNTLVYDHMFNESNKVLATVDYKAILASRNDNGPVRVSFYLDDMPSSNVDKNNWDAYYGTTAQNHGGEVPTWDGYVSATGPTSVEPFNYFQSQSSTVLNFANIQGSDDVLVRDAYVADSGSFTDMMNKETVGSYAWINYLNAGYGEIKLEEMGLYSEADMFLWHVRHNNNNTGYTLADDFNTSLGVVSRIRFNAETGAITLNSDQPISAVPVPAAAWLLGSGLLGMFGLRRRK